ncbi:hypothetical protein HK105_208023 [Polyrhizophydium stewartii]|uniref:Ankyrin repeat protein n=1 Tax=Polyrhizophydium stewartii TaxID=2732419 RepID=A0ABR4MZ40_9FUNG
MDTPHAALAAALGQQQPAALESVAAMLARLTAAVDAQPKDSDVLGRIASLEDSHRRTQDRATQLAARVAVLQAAVERLEADNKRLSAEVAALRQPPSAAAPPAGRSDPPAPCRRTNGFRPDATNEWDRMPAEIQNKILDAAGPFTKFVNGLLLAAELRALPDKQREQVWQDANDVEWQGDVKSLPPVDITRESLRMSRWFIKRLRGRHIEWDVAQVMVRNGWTDMFDFEQPDALAWAAASEGDVELLRELINVRRAVRPSRGLFEAVAVKGHLDAVKLLHELAPRNMWSSSVDEKAAQSGNLDLVVWLKEHRSGSLYVDSLIGAACGNHMHIVRWLVENTELVCDHRPFIWAALHNNLEMLKLLHDKYPDELDNAHCNFLASEADVLEWLEEHSVLGFGGLAEHLAETGKIDVLDWALTRFDIKLTEWDLVIAHWLCRNELLRWAYERGVPFTAMSAEWAAAHCNVAIMNWIIARDRAVIPTLVEATAKHGHKALAEWWRVRHGVVVGQIELDATK